MRTSIFRIELAMQGKQDFLVKTGVWVPDKKKAPAEKPKGGVGKGLLAALRAHPGYRKAA